MSMKKSITAVSLLLAVLMMITMLTACADNSIPSGPNRSGGSRS